MKLYPLNSFAPIINKSRIDVWLATWFNCPRNKTPVVVEGCSLNICDNCEKLKEIWGQPWLIHCNKVSNSISCRQSSGCNCLSFFTSSKLNLSYFQNERLRYFELFTSCNSTTSYHHLLTLHNEQVTCKTLDLL